MENLQELNASEKEEIKGGLGIFESVVVGLVIAAGAAIVNDWENFKRGLDGAPPIQK